MCETIVKGYLKEVKLVDLEGKSFGETPHYFFQMFFPLRREFYISDTVKDIESDILNELHKNDIISDTNYCVKVVSGGGIHIERKELFTDAE